ncbi:MULTISPECIES: type IV pilin protein [unclassified Aliivibrio]|uniref:type IV pilin protein n=1 Tax=unclassified Aliivibrio TaxID=2645654 RepID=UPI00080E80C0|nr:MULTISPECIES: type IV pilin protein [unclassified Aliivibrio]OCH14936.1 pilin [Aliivibrio sp. 1S128]OCH16175.1 pilin [Aliivibrio sp. 1S165]OCH33877.1 pilin [Aliivibrio sp. 1S175]
MIRIFSQVKTYKFHRGVTLVELLITTSIIAVLSTIAYPSYTSYILKSHRTEALEALTKTQLHIESLYSTRTESTSKEKYQALLALTINNNNGSCLQDHICKVDNNRYLLSYNLASSSMSIYTLSATPQSELGQNNDRCGTLTLNAGGVGLSDSSGCW